MPLTAGVNVGIFLKWLSYDLVKSFLIKAFVTVLMTTLLPIILFKLFAQVLEWTMAYAQQQITAAGGASSVTLEFTSLAAWIAQTIQLPECFSIFMSALALKFTLRMISSRF